MACLHIHSMILTSDGSKLGIGDQESMQLTLKSQHRHQVGKKKHKNSKHFYDNTPAVRLALSKQGSHPAKFQPKQRTTSPTERQEQ